MRIAVVGAGAIGGYVGGRLAFAGEDVTFIARGAHLQAMQNSGLRIERPGSDLDLPEVTATDDPARAGPVDLVLFTVKLGDTERAAQVLAPLLGPDTRVLTLQNGIDSVDLISRSVPRARVLAGVIYISAVIASPGVIKSPGGPHRIIVDEAGGNETVARFVEACGRATALDASTTSSIDTVIWEKFIALSATSGSTSLLRSSMGPILANPETQTLLRQLLDEGVAIAGAVGIPIRGGFAEEMMGLIASFPPSFRSSMADDLSRGKALELNWLAGRLHALGLRLGVPTPAQSAVYRGLVLHANGETGVGKVV